MISYTAYRLVHLFGILLLFVMLGGLSYAAARGEAGSGGVSHKATTALHGLALLIVLVGGFGLLARIGVEHGAGFPGWIWAKVAIWALPW